MMLQLTSYCFTNGHQININFVEDTKYLQKMIRQGNRVLWIDYGCCLDTDSFPMIFDQAKRDVLVFPAVKEGVDWDRFKRLVKDTTEPIEQVGLDFDTDVDRKVSDGVWTVKRTVPKVFVIDGSAVDKKMRTKKGEGLRLPRDIDQIFEKFAESGVTIHAWVKAKIIVHYTHECVGNILEANGVKINA